MQQQAVTLSVTDEELLYLIDWRSTDGRHAHARLQEGLALRDAGNTVGEGLGE